VNALHEEIEKCQKCGVRDVELVCRTCGAGFCHNCVLVNKVNFPYCLNCGSRNVEKYKAKISRGSDFSYYICKDCKSKKITVITKYVKTCPKCGSSDVVDFAKEQADLKMNFRRLCSELRYGYLKLNEVAHTFDLIKRSVVFLRHSRVFNYPVIERTLVDVFDEFNLIKMRILGKTEEVGNLFLSVAPRFFIDSRFKVRDLPFLRGVLARLEAELKNYKEYVEESIKEVEEKLAKLEVLTSSLYQHYQEFSKYKDVLSLDMDENPIYVIPDAKFLGLTRTQTPKGEGILFLTSKRLIFLSKKGLVKKRLYKLLEIPLNTINGVEIRGRLKKRIVMRCNSEDLIFSFPVKMLSLVKDYINVALNFESYSLRDTGIVSKVANLTLETSDLKIKIENILKKISKTEESRTIIPKVTMVRKESYSPITSVNRFKMELYDLERERYEIEESLKELKRRFESGMISVENYFKYYRSWIGRLYAIEKRISELKDKSQSYLAT